MSIVSFVIALVVLTNSSDVLPNVTQSESSSSRTALSLAPAYCNALHSIGNFTQHVTNGGKLGVWALGIDPGSAVECSLVPNPPSGYGYPKGSDISYLFESDLWIGGIIGVDTLVSVGSDGWHIDRFDFFPDQEPNGRIQHRSTLDATIEQFNGAISEQDFIAVYTDTFTYGVPGLEPDIMSGRAHKPLHVEITQKSYAWSPGYVDDFVLLDYAIKNIGETRIDGVYAAFYVDGDVGFMRTEFGSADDDLCGFLQDYPSADGCGFIDTVNIAWIADDDGDPLQGNWANTTTAKSCRGIAGIQFLKTPPGSQISFNWWVGNRDARLDFGPRNRPSDQHPYRDFRTGGTGTPEGDGNKYYLMSNGEFDYNQTSTAAISVNDPTWIYPNQQVARVVSQGGDTRYLLSLGPFELASGEEIPVSLALVFGENFQIDTQVKKYLEAGNSAEYYRHVDFGPFVRNAKWAEWVYDNPGVDTDSDGYAGAYRVCVLDSQFIDDHWVIMAADTTWYKGDGVPDWRAVQPPPAPTFWLEPTLNGIRVRFNGQRSETTKDIFSNIIDFEGYRIYLGRDERESSLSLAASYDKENYDIYVWNPKLYPSGDFEIQHIPSTLTELRCRFGTGIDPCDDSTFAPLAFTRTNPWRSQFFADSLFYFMPHENNVDQAGADTPIRKVYPDAIPPGPTDTVTAEDLTPEGYLKCYEYECFIDDLLPTVSYYVNVTAFDFGSPEADLAALETSKLLGIQSAYPFADQNQSDSTLPPVYIYPNPYRYDAQYRDMGYEGRGSNRIDERERRVHFVNVPAKCTIRIHTLDGDLVRELRHDEDPSDPNSHHATWDLINRNVQAIVSGLYYWTVESTDGSVQIGKLVVIQ